MKEIASFKIGGDTLSITTNGVQWSNKIIDSYISNPVEIRYGTRPIELEAFTIGSNYRLELRDKDKNRLIVSLNSYFRIAEPS